MKRYFTFQVFLSAVFLSVSGFVFSQEIGSAGKLLSNEIKRNAAVEVQSAGNYQYRWTQPYERGYSEVFIRIPEMGRFTISIDGQEITSHTGMFRFFDIIPGRQALTISEGRRVVYKVMLNPRQNSRLVLDYFSQEGLFLLEEIDLLSVNEVYYGDGWNGVWNRSYGGGGTVFGNDDFNAFLNVYTKKMFDDDKLNFFQMQKSTTRFTTEQIGRLMREMSFDDKRLELAKSAYETVLDPQNYYRLHEYFDFSMEADKLNDYIRKANRR